MNPGNSVIPGRSTRRAPAGMPPPWDPTAVMRPAVMVICGWSTVLPAITAIMWSAVTTTVSAQLTLMRPQPSAASIQRAFISVMSPRTVHVAVRKLFFGCIPDLDELDDEIQVYRCQRMDAIDGHHIAGDGCYGYGARALLRLGMQAHSDRNLVDPLEGATRNLLD